MIPVISFVGRSNVGKTTYLEKLITELTRRGIKVAVIKHTQHFEMDKPGKDTYRHARAGASTVVISSPEKMALLDYSGQERPLDEITAVITGVDLIITEGYKHGDKPKIEVCRRETSQELVCSLEELVAVVADFPLEVDVPRFDLDDAVPLADFLQYKILK
ncbi:molybdopterin-guanine dinucleotide biosynthesis protein B [Metallumcola ferriviriculae]|uniref:Molybdopterin-guanine dinucleotide biosynthesis protein B n=1 Tax=Metallumcola ferriviriculae TaxID=3039180 RepID=A0AAU0UJ05_9FIRM|nr:molybdopterin-guanine dinucleotide biosynthesis protein B [Desulfitibacteraceae bacterium MK1]